MLANNLDAIQYHHKTKSPYKILKLFTLIFSVPPSPSSLSNSLPSCPPPWNIPMLIQQTEGGGERGGIWRPYSRNQEFHWPKSGQNFNWLAAHSLYVKE